MMTPAVHTLPPRVRRVAPGLLGVALFACCIALAGWLMERPLVRGHGPYYQRARTGQRQTAGAAALALGLAAAAMPGVTGDSATAGGYAVHLADANTAAGAILLLRQMGADLPAGTYVAIPHVVAGEYQVLAGAYRDSVEAAGLLDDLRSHGQLSESGGTVVHVPLAYMIERDVAAGSAAARMAVYTARGVPVYALRQADGRARLYAGAFASASDTTLLAAALRRAGVHATLAYRTGRPF